MADKHQGNWLNQLPFVLLGKRVALQPDVGASPCELAMGMNVRIPGQILRDPGAEPSPDDLQDLLQKVRRSTDNPAIQTSSHNRKEETLKAIPPNVTHVYTKQHKATGLQAPFEGPFRIVSRPSRSTVIIEVGQYVSGEKRYETRHFNDLKLAHPDSMAAPARRPKLGRPSGSSLTEVQQSTGDKDVVETTPSNRLDRSNNVPEPPSYQPVDINAKNKQPTLGKSKDSTHATSISTDRQPASAASADGGGRPARSTRNPNPVYVSASQAAWSATSQQLELLNHDISRGRHLPSEISSYITS